MWIIKDVFCSKYLNGVQVKMKRKVLITGPTLTSDALLYAQSHDIQLIPTEPYMAKDEME